MKPARMSGAELRRALHNMLTQAEIDFDMWLAMRRARGSDDVILMLNRRYGRFYMAAENALFNSVVTLLYACFEKRKDTVNFWCLRDALVSEAESKTSVEELDDQYNEIKQLWLKISVLRNEVVGHQTLERTRGESHEKAGLSVNDIRTMLAKCQGLLFTIGTRFQDTHLVFNLKGAAAFENLIADLRSNRALQPDVPSSASLRSGRVADERRCCTDKRTEMNDRSDVVSNTRNYVLGVCGLLGGADYLLYDKSHEYQSVKVSITAFSIAIIIGIVRIGIFYWDELYGGNHPEGNEKFFSFTMRGKFSLMLFIVLVGVGLVSLLVHALSA